jgi:hypothetical protein
VIGGGFAIAFLIDMEPMDTLTGCSAPTKEMYAAPCICRHDALLTQPQALDRIARCPVHGRATEIRSWEAERAALHRNFQQVEQEDNCREE